MLTSMKTHVALLDPLAWMAGPRRYRSGFCTEVLDDFILAQRFGF
jgi:hypothetical protein